MGQQWVQGLKDKQDKQVLAENIAAALREVLRGKMARHHQNTPDNLG